MCKTFNACCGVPSIDMNPIAGESSIVYEERETNEQYTEKMEAFYLKTLPGQDVGIVKVIK